MPFFQLVSRGPNFNQSLKTSNKNFSSNETHFSDWLDRGFEISAYEEERIFEVKSVVGFYGDSLLKSHLSMDAMTTFCYAN